METRDRNSADETDEELYDRYLDAALEGRVEDPAAFLGRHPGAGDALRGKLAAVHRVVATGQAARTARSGRREPLPADPGLPFERLGEFRLLRRLEQGGMGTVYLAEQGSLGRLVALKVLRPELEDSPTAAARLEREALAVAKLDHPHVVKIHAVGGDHGVRFLAMEFVQGRGLDELFAEAAARGERVAASDLLRWGAQLARALAAAHAQGIVHRDVKPANVRVTPDGRAMLLDFGIARDLRTAGLTMTGPLIGSPVYAAPEQVGGRTATVDARTDVYGLGATLYEGLSGRPPFEAETMERLLHRMLREEPPPLRRLAPGVSREVETIVRKAMEKEPARRYDDAVALAEDIEAVLALRPIRARPPGVLLRAWKWSRRHPGPATAIATAAAAGLLLGGVLVARDLADAAEVRRRAVALVADARQQVDRYREARAATEALERQVDRLGEELGAKYLSEEQTAHLDGQEDRVASLRRAREEAFYEVLDLLGQAERFDRDVAGVAEVRATLYLERWHEARAARDPAAAAFYRDIVLRLDQGGDVAAALTGAGHLEARCDVPGAEVHLFRYVDLSSLRPGAPPRRVPVPVMEADAPVAPGTVCLVVEAAGGGLEAGDLVLSVGGRAVEALSREEVLAALREGAATAQVHSRGAVRDGSLPAGLRAHRTAAPAVIDPGCRVVPGARRGVEPGEYLLVARAPGREPTRAWLQLERGDERTVPLELLPEGSTPPGFVHVPRQQGSSRPPFWIMRREVTVAEYRTFLDAPVTRAEIQASAVPTRFPRDPTSAQEGGFWHYRPDGTYETAADPELPAYGVSRDDADAYAAWWSRREGLAARGLVAAIPTHAQWVAASGALATRRYVFGSRFRPRFASSCYSQPQPAIERVLSYPVDESPAGVCDLAGSMMEWVSGDYLGELGRLCGGSWARANPKEFEIFSGRALRPDMGYGESGFRLVLRRAAEHADADASAADAAGDRER